MTIHIYKLLTIIDHHTLHSEIQIQHERLLRCLRISIHIYKELNVFYSELMACSQASLSY